MKEGVEMVEVFERSVRPQAIIRKKLLYMNLSR